MKENKKPRMKKDLIGIYGKIQESGNFGHNCILTKESLKKAVELAPEVPLLLGYNPDNAIGMMRLEWNEEEQAIIGNGFIKKSEIEDKLEKTGLALGIEIDKRILNKEKVTVDQFVIRNVGVCPKNSIIGKSYVINTIEEIK